jgi:hypothetical protein
LKLVQAKPGALADTSPGWEEVEIPTESSSIRRAWVSREEQNWTLRVQFASSVRLDGLQDSFGPLLNSGLELPSGSWFAARFFPSQKCAVSIQVPVALDLLATAIPAIDEFTLRRADAEDQRPKAAVPRPGKATAASEERYSIAVAALCRQLLSAGARADAALAAMGMTKDKPTAEVQGLTADASFRMTVSSRIDDYRPAVPMLELQLSIPTAPGLQMDRLAQHLGRYERYVPTTDVESFGVWFPEMKEALSRCQIRAVGPWAPSARQWTVRELQVRFRWNATNQHP